MAQQCGSCQATNRDGARFCKECGGRLNPQTELAEATAEASPPAHWAETQRMALASTTHTDDEPTVLLGSGRTAVLPDEFPDEIRPDPDDDPSPRISRPAPLTTPTVSTNSRPAPLSSRPMPLQEDGDAPARPRTSIEQSNIRRNPARRGLISALAGVAVFAVAVWLIYGALRPVPAQIGRGAVATAPVTPDSPVTPSANAAGAQASSTATPAVNTAAAPTAVGAVAAIPPVTASSADPAAVIAPQPPPSMGMGPAAEAPTQAFVNLNAPAPAPVETPAPPVEKTVAAKPVARSPSAAEARAARSKKTAPVSVAAAPVDPTPPPAVEVVAAAPVAPPPPANPETACASQGFFGRSRCMVAECAKPGTRAHPACEAVRRQQQIDEEKRNPTLAN